MGIKIESGWTGLRKCGCGTTTGSELLGCRRRKYVRPRRQPDREGRANVETLNSVVVFPGIGKHASKQHKHDGNRDQEREECMRERSEALYMRTTSGASAPTAP